MSRSMVRRAGVVSRREGAEVLVLDLDSQAAHCLQDDVALVWESIAARSSAAEVVADTGLEPERVDAALDALAELGLVVGASVEAGVSRRALTRGLAIGGGAVAAGVVSIPLPAAARANSSTFTLTKVSCVSGLLNLLLGTPLQFRVNLTGAGRLTPGATYTVTFSYASAVLNPLGIGIITYTQTDSFQFTADSSGRIAGGAGAVFTASAAYHGGMSTVTVTNTADPSDKNVFTPSPAIPSC